MRGVKLGGHVVGPFDMPVEVRKHPGEAVPGG